VATDKRELLLIVRGQDQGGKKVLDGLADGAEDAQDEVGDLNKGLKKLDGQIAASTDKVEALRREISKSGDLGLVKDLEKAQRELNKLTKQRKLIVPVELEIDKDVDLRGAGADSAQGFAVGFTQRLGPLLAKAPISPVMIGVLGGAAAAAAPTIASAVAGAVTAGVGLAAVGAGLKIAFTDPSVKAAGEGLKAQLGDQLKDSAKPFVPATLFSIGIVRKEFRSLKPVLDDVFADAALYVAPLTRGLGGFAREIAPGIRNAVRNAEPLIDMLEDHIPRAGAAVSSVLTDLSSVSKESANTISAILTVTESSIAGVGKGVQALSVINKFAGSGPLKTFGDLVKDNDDGTENWNQDLGKLNNTLGEFRGKAYDAAGAARDFATAMDQVHDNNLTAAEAVLGLKEALAEQKDVVDKKKGTNAEEERWLIDLARRSNEAASALDAQGRSAKESAAHHRQIRTDFINAAIAAGKTRAAAEALANQYLNTPKNVNTKMNVNKQQAERDLDRINAKANHAARDRVIWFHPRQSGSLGAIGQRSMAQGGYLDDLPGPKGVDSGLIAAARGEYVVKASAVDRVGVEALDAINSGRSPRMMSAGAAMAGAGRGYGGALQVRVSAAAGLDGEASRLLMKLIRVEVAGPGSGSVQRAFG
jgi:hypothetical protein